MERQFDARSIEWEQLLALQYRACLRQPRTVVDVGAYIGRHVDQLLQIGARQVVAFEPVAQLASDIRSRFGDADRLIVHEVALAAEPGSSEFFIDRSQPGASGMRVRGDADRHVLYATQVAVDTLDHFGLSGVDYIKIDVEGAELLVLEGAHETLAASRPLVSVEFGRDAYQPYGLHRRSLLEWAEANDYAVCDLFGSPLSGATYDECVDRFYWDYLLAPAENLRLRSSLQLTGRTMLTSIERFVAAASAL